MLDQNTDRMWYVIGALVVGAGIILLANKAMPEVFASVADTFKGKTDEVTSVVDEIGARPNLLLGTSHEWSEHLVKQYVADTGQSSSYRAIADVNLEPGDVVTFSGEYDVGDYLFAPRINFSPVPIDTDDEREMARFGETFTGEGEFSFTVVVPEHTKYFRTMISNRNGSDASDWPDTIRLRKIKLEEGDSATPWVP